MYDFEILLHNIIINAFIILILNAILKTEIIDFSVYEMLNM